MQEFAATRRGDSTEGRLDYAGFRYYSRVPHTSLLVCVFATPTLVSRRPHNPLTLRPCPGDLGSLCRPRLWSEVIARQAFAKVIKRLLRRINDAEQLAVI